MNFLNLRQILSKRACLLAIVHLVIFAFSYWLAFEQRFDFVIPREMWHLFWGTLPWICVLKLGVFYFSGNYHGWWRYVTFSDFVALLRASTISLLLIAATDHFLIWDYQIPRAALLFDWAISILLLGGLRSAWRFSREQFRHMLNRNGYRPALIVGADQSGVVLANQIQAHPRLQSRIVGFLDPDSSKHGSRLGGIPILGTPEEAVPISTAYDIKDILVIAGSLPGKCVRELMERCAQASVTLKIIPAVDNLLHGRQGLHVRDVDINDLLRREPVELDCGAIETLLKGHRVVVTGAGGSIGSEICRQILRFNPQALVLVERAENNLFAIDRELRGLGTSSKVHPCVGDILDRRRLHQIFALHRPQVVFHAAAHKHVPMMESNPGEAIKNNIIGTKRLADAALRFGVESFVMISSDKAVHPSSVMGVTKQMAERYVHSLSHVSTTKFVVVRFGNVLASTGSVVPIFQEQIRRGGPITVTHPLMTRFFMTIPEASQLVLQAAAMGQGGEIFVLDMGEPVKIVDLARDLIHLSGLSPDDIEITFCEPRPGEKLFEELYLEDEQTLPTAHHKVSAAYPRPHSAAEVRRAIAALYKVCHESDQVIRQNLREFVPEYQSAEFARSSAPEHVVLDAPPASVGPDPQSLGQVRAAHA